MSKDGHGTDGEEKLQKISTGCVGCTNVTDRQTYRRHMERR